MKQLATLFAIGFLSLNSTQAFSDLIEIELTGIINSASWDFSVYGFGGLPYTVGMNDVMTQTYVYDDNAQTLVSANTAINGQVFGIESLTSGIVTLSDNSIVGDQVHAELNGTSTGYTALSQAYVSMTIDLFDSTGTAFAGTDLTGFDLVPADYDIGFLGLNVDADPYGASAFAISAVISDAQITNLSAVPVPAAVWLFGSGLLGLWGLTRRNN